MRERALIKYKKTQMPQHWEYYKNLRNFTKQVITNEKKAFLQYKINSSNYKSVWKDLKDLNIYSKQKCGNIPEDLSDPNILNNYFISASQTGNVPNGDTLNYFSNNTKENIEEFQFVLTHNSEVEKFLSQIKSKAVGIDKISVKMLLYCCPKIVPYITHIINECILHKYYPQCWKFALVVPLPKIAQPSELKDLRNICILPTLSKVFENIINSQIRNHLSKFNILAETQSGFRPGYSCTTALLEVVDDVLTATDANKLTVLVLLDYSKAFDRINHRLLLAMLHYYGFGADAEALMSSYLEGRQQKVILNNADCQPLQISSGVPQGSILGPLLFIIYTSNLKNCLRHCKVHFYADDTQIYFSFGFSDLNNASRIINTNLDLLVKASENICLTINPSKSMAMLFGPKTLRSKSLANLTIKIGNEIIKFSENARNLGLYIDSNLRFTNYVNLMIKRAYSNLKLIYGNSSLLNDKIKIMLCNSLVLSHFNYCDVIYHACLTEFDASRIQRLQNSCVRLICHVKKFDHISHKIKELGWLTMKQRRLLHSCVIYHKIITENSPSYLYKKIKFRHNVHDLNTRNKNILTPPMHRTSLFERSFQFNICKIYNSIPPETKLCNVNLFKKRMSQLIFENNFYP